MYFSSGNGQSAAAAWPITFGGHAGSSIPQLRGNSGNELSTGCSR